MFCGPSSPRARRRPNLRKALHYARQATAAENGSGVIGSDGALLCLPTEDLWVDVDAFLAAAARARQAGDPEAYWEAIGLYRDGLLPDDRYEEWLIARRDELQLEFLAILEEVAARRRTVCATGAGARGAG